jgi:hypothetical protein
MTTSITNEATVKELGFDPNGLVEAATRKGYSQSEAETIAKKIIDGVLKARAGDKAAYDKVFSKYLALIAD